MVRWLRNNLNLKILSLVLAVMLWMVVNMTTRGVQPVTPLNPPTSAPIVREIQNMPITPRLDDQEMVIVKMQKYADLTLRGERSVLEGAISPDRFQVFVDLKGLPSGTERVPVQVTGFPPGVEVTVNPAFIDVTLELKQRKVMPVTAEVIGKPKEGYTTGTPIINPVNVHVKAAKSQLDQIAFVKGFINIDGASGDVRKKVALKVIDVNGNTVPVEIEPNVVEITVPISHPFVTVPLQLQVKGEPPAGFAVAKITPSENMVSLFGSKEKLSGIDYYTGPAIDVSTLTKTTTLELPIPNPDGFEISPQKIKVTVEIVPSVKKEFANIPIEITGLPKEYQGNILDPTDGKITITLEGAPEIINQITPADLKANILLSGLPPGTQTVPIELILPSFVKTAGISTPTVKVEIVDAKSTSGNPDSPPPSGDSHPPTGDKNPSNQKGNQEGTG
ncbi:CdaR family protein [Thermicanus aegyptius]|uniref:CdaR family protein n=1 Tax=Thermicanus aegyptius TaxID=94009 RepID=UPI000412C15A|nr:CdaR family protein [Thermicanus aegyptius]